MLHLEVLSCKKIFLLHIMFTESWIYQVSFNWMVILEKGRSIKYKHSFSGCFHEHPHSTRRKQVNLLFLRGFFFFYIVPVAHNYNFYEINYWKFSGSFPSKEFHNEWVICNYMNYRFLEFTNLHTAQSLFLTVLFIYC